MPGVALTTERFTISLLVNGPVICQLQIILNILQPPQVRNLEPFISYEITFGMQVYEYKYILHNGLLVDLHDRKNLSMVLLVSRDVRYKDRLVKPLWNDFS